MLADLSFPIWSVIFEMAERGPFSGWAPILELSDEVLNRISGIALTR